MPVVTPGQSPSVSSVIDLIGNTPLIRLSSFEAGLRNVELYAKAEWRNPGGSVKDRPAARMIADGERSGALTRDKILLDATSGNTGIAYAMIGAARGYRVRLCVPENVTPERKRILKAFGAEVVFTDPMEGSDGAIIKAQGDVRGGSGLVLLSGPVQQPRQLARALRHHRRRRSSSRRRAASRTSWPASARAARSSAPAGACASSSRRIRLISVQPDSPLHGLEGLKHMATAIVPGIYDPALADEDLGVEHRRGVRAARGGWRKEGLFVGISSGANLAGALNVARAGAGRGDRRDLLRRRREVSVRALLGRQAATVRPRAGRADGRCTLEAGVADAIRAHGVETYPERMLRRAVRPRRRGHGHVRAAEHHRGRPAAAVPRAAAGLPRGRAARHRDGRRAARLLPLAPGSSRRGRRSTTSTTRGRSFRTSSCP